MAYKNLFKHVYCATIDDNGTDVDVYTNDDGQVCVEYDDGSVVVCSED